MNLEPQKGAHGEDKDRLEQPELDDHQQNGLPEVHVLYLNVPASDEPQVLDLSSLLVHEGIQMVESSESTDQIPDGCHINESQEIVSEGNGGAAVTVITTQAEMHAKGRPAHTLVHLSKSQGDGSDLQVSDILAAHRHTEHIMGEGEQNTPAEALLQLSTDPGAGTYIVDENGTMIPISHMRPTTLLEVEDTGVTTIAICQCWCGREFISQEDLDRHKLAHKYQTQGRLNLGMQKCTLCLENFMTHKELRVHHAEVHPGGTPWECNICNRMFHKKIAMKAHMRVHSTLTRYQCTSCKKVFFYKTALNRHLKMHSFEKPFKCTICGDMYHSLWDLRKHRMNHQPPKLFPCDICTKVFKQKQTLFVHSRIHTGQKPYSCEVCHRNFSLKSTLVQHRRIHTGEKPNVCHVCQRTFRQNSTLKAHLRTHTSLKPFMCRYCKMRFAYKDEVTEHEHTHIQNKTWQCEECGMWFKNQSLLSRHSRVHTNERPFHCKICCKSFIQSGSLQSHMRSHTKEKPYQCRICSKAYYTSGTLLVHIRKFHNVDAKSVKDVFPEYNYIEDQKVFIIRNCLMADLKSVIDGGDHDKVDDAEKTSLEKLLSKGETIVEELMEEASDITLSENRSFSGEFISPDLESSSPQSCQKEYNADQAVLAERHKNTYTEKAAGTVLNEVLNDCVQTENATIEISIHTGEEEQIPQNSHTALDRQEAALGLAGLSLTGGEGIHLEKSAAKTRTFFREEEEDESDPNVTKIILSKEGGIMNSQDPHQCPVCGRIFGRKSIMTEHIRIHTDEKPYECDFCQTRFRQNAQLRSHIRNRHTQVERYQCSFCHNRFLSRSITIRHINFHHKLKLKYCQNTDPSWTVNRAVWCDDSFELNVNNPQFLKTDSRKADNKEANDPVHVTEMVVSDTEQKVESEQPVQTHSKYVIKVSLPSTLGKDSELQVEENGHTQESRSPENTEQLNVETVNPTSSELITGTSYTQDSNIDLSYAESQLQTSSRDCIDVASTRKEVRSKPLETEVCVQVSSEAEFGSSRLLCGTCAMQFRGVSSLRHHLRKVHNTTLAQSEVSYIYEDGRLQNSEMQMGVETGTVKQCAMTSKQKSERTIPCENESVKIVVYDDSKKCADNPGTANMPYKCRMCSLQYISKTSLEEHMRSHSEEDVEKVGLHRCDICAFVMKNTQQVTKHILKYHGVKQIYVCSICHREFFQQSSVYRHMKFLHKWEIKIRGESSIPILLKPAPASIHAPVSISSAVRVRKESVTEHLRTSTTKTDNNDENVAYISLEVGDMENLQIFKGDGREVYFEVVATDDKIKTLKLRDGNLTSDNPGTETLDVPHNSFIEGDTVPDLGDQSVTSTMINDTETSANMITAASSSPSSSVTKNTKTSSTTGTNSFIIVGNDKSNFTVSKEIISQLVAAIKSNSHEIKLESGKSVSKVIKIQNFSDTARVSQAGTSSSDDMKIELGLEVGVESEKNTLKCSELSVSNSAAVTYGSNSCTSVIMSVNDNGTGDCKQIMKKQKKIEIIGTQLSTENTDANLVSVVTVSDRLKCQTHKDKHFVPETDTAAVHSFKETNQKKAEASLATTAERSETKTNKFAKNVKDIVNNKPITGTRGQKTQSTNVHIKNTAKTIKTEKNLLKTKKGKKKVKLFAVSGTSSSQGLLTEEESSAVELNKLCSSISDKPLTSSAIKIETHQNASLKMSTSKSPVSSSKLTSNSDSSPVQRSKLSQKLTTTAEHESSVTKIPENCDKPAERRSSSGRLIKRKLFMDETMEVQVMKRKREKQ